MATIKSEQRKQATGNSACRKEAERKKGKRAVENAAKETGIREKRKKKKEGRKNMIWEELKTKLIFIDLDAKDTKEVFEQVGGAFIKEGYAKETYIQGLIDREAEFPTGLDIDGFGVAIPHTPVEHVNKTGTAIAVLRNPVTFHEMGGDDEDTVEARLIIMFCVDQPSAHIDKLQRTITIIQDKEVLGKIEKAKEPQEIINIIKDKEAAMDE